MCSVSFYGQGESTGSVAKFPTSVAFHGESTGSIAKIPNTNSQIASPTLTSDTVNFKGRDGEKKSSIAKTFTGLILAGATIIGGLAYTHKSGVLNKIKNGTIKKYLSNASETCYNWCNKAKNSSCEYYNKIKNYFRKK